MTIPTDAENESDKAFNVLCEAVEKVVDRKRRLGQYWIEWDGEKPVKVYPENPTDAAAE